ncbi:UV damage endonuclease UvsE [Kouleothrix sp.]|uniref:UV damage endonuclease UvsE n=1 Tax=Kouleothrix sp. TaxID=2779161 RepID=UPI00391B4D9C
MIRLGVAVKIMGQGGLRARDGRRAEHAPHLSVSLLLVREVLLYLASQQIGCYRLADDLVPGDDTGDDALRQVGACADMLAETGALARAHGIRLSMHMPLHVQLAAPDGALAARAAAAIGLRARLLDALGCGGEAVLVLHVGGAHGDRQAALERFAARYERLPEPARRRIVLEHDEDCFSLADLLRLHQITGAPIVLDSLHHQINDPAGIPLGAALALALASWPRGVRPKLHFSSQRTEAHVLPARRGAQQRVLAPQLGQHADFANPFELIGLLRAARGLPEFDIMLEAKAADLALLRLRDDLRRLAPELAKEVA